MFTLLKQLPTRHLNSELKNPLYNSGDEPSWKVEEIMEDNNNTSLEELDCVHCQGFLLGLLSFRLLFPQIASVIRLVNYLLILNGQVAICVLMSLNIFLVSYLIFNKFLRYIVVN